LDIGNATACVIYAVALRLKAGEARGVAGLIVSPYEVVHISPFCLSRKGRLISRSAPYLAHGNGRIGSATTDGIEELDLGDRIVCGVC